MNFTWFDSNSWLIELAGKRILLDPWLVGTLSFSNLNWLFKGEKTTSRPIPEAIDLILLSQGLEDHAHPPTLQQLDRNIPVVASPNAAKVVRALGYKQITELPHKEKTTLGEQVEIKAVSGSPIGPQLVENGYILKDLVNQQTIYYEPHGYHSPSIKEDAPIDVIMTPVINIQLPLLGAVIQGKQKALEVCQWLQPQVILPTAAGGDITYEGLLTTVLRNEGSAEDFRALLAQNGLTTQVIAPKPGEAFTVELQQRNADAIA
jgi:L-ascorbate metabolism protein UlaG (beta-lactamase superfamily)